MSFIQGIQGAVNYVNDKKNYLDTLAQSVASKFLLSTNNVQGIDGFLFDQEGESSASLDSEITDHYIEDNTVIHDHVTTKPVRITLKGFVGENVALNAGNAASVLGIVNSKLSTVEAYMGAYTPQMLGTVQKAITSAQNTLTAVNQSLARVNNVVNYLAGATEKTKQETAYDKLFSIWSSHKICSIMTPFTKYDNMLIERITMTQYEDSKSYSDIVVTLKQIRLINDMATVADSTGRAVAQRSPLKNSGTVIGTTKPTAGVTSAFKKP